MFAEAFFNISATRKREWKINCKVEDFLANISADCLNQALHQMTKPYSYANISYFHDVGVKHKG